MDQENKTRAPKNQRNFANFDTDQFYRKTATTKCKFNTILQDQHAAQWFRNCLKDVLRFQNQQRVTTSLK